MSSQRVTTTSGLLEGESRENANVFLDVPYAAPVTAAGRFGPPDRHPGWRGIRDARRPGPTAPQPDRSRFGALDVSPFFDGGWIADEEYLTLNIWTPTRGPGSWPVLVFLHGGAFVAGSNRAPAYDGATFARDGIMFIAVNYRLGIPGFLSLPDAPDNRGCRDVLAALQWIHENAAEFGGNPDNVTLAGQSAGAIIIATLLATGDGRGLYHRAIIQSGSGTAAFTHEQAAIVAEAVAQQVGTAATAAAISSVRDRALIDALGGLATLDLDTERAPHPVGGIVLVGPTLDAQPADLLIRSDQPSVIPLLIGSNSDEAALYLSQVPPAAGDDELIPAARRFDRRPEQLVARYRAAHPSATPTALRTALVSDAMFIDGTTRLADAHATRGGPTFRYEFTWRSNALDGALGACHLIELPFVFDHADLPALNGPNALLGTSPPPADLAARVHATWIQFAAHADPGWPACTPEKPILQHIGERWERTAA